MSATLANHIMSIEEVSVCSTLLDLTAELARRSSASKSLTRRLTPLPLLAKVRARKPEFQHATHEACVAIDYIAKTPEGAFLLGFTMTTLLTCVLVIAH